jgi:hypothetical protein
VESFSFSPDFMAAFTSASMRCCGGVVVMGGDYRVAGIIEAREKGTSGTAGTPGTRGRLPRPWLLRPCCPWCP